MPIEAIKDIDMLDEYHTQPPRATGQNQLSCSDFHWQEAQINQQDAKYELDVDGNPAFINSERIEGGLTADVRASDRKGAESVRRHQEPSISEGRPQAAPPYCRQRQWN